MQLIQITMNQHQSGSQDADYDPEASAQAINFFKEREIFPSQEGDQQNADESPDLPSPTSK